MNDELVALNIVPSAANVLKHALECGANGALIAYNDSATAQYHSANSTTIISAIVGWVQITNTCLKPTNMH